MFEKQLQHLNNSPTSTTTLGLAFSQTSTICKAANRFKSLPSEQKQSYHVAEDHSKQSKVNRSKQTKIDGLFVKEPRCKLTPRLTFIRYLCVCVCVCVCVYIYIYFFFFITDHTLSSIIRSNSKSPNQGLQSRKEPKYLYFPYNSSYFIN